MKLFTNAPVRWDEDQSRRQDYVVSEASQLTTN
jgi:hypothetical protein